jgi:hypothetical protein
VLHPRIHLDLGRPSSAHQRHAEGSFYLTLPLAVIRTMYSSDIPLSQQHNVDPPVAKNYLGIRTNIRCDATFILNPTPNHTRSNEGPAHSTESTESDAFVLVTFASHERTHPSDLLFQQYKAIYIKRGPSTSRKLSRNQKQRQM